MLQDVQIERRNTVLADRRAHPRVSVDTGQLRERRKRGRPSIDPNGGSERVSTRVSCDTFDTLCEMASDAGKELAEFVRERLDELARRRISVAKNRQHDPSAPI